jgi:hypothetical protein
MDTTQKTDLKNFTFSKPYKIEFCERAKEYFTNLNFQDISVNLTKGNLAEMEILERVVYENITDTFLVYVHSKIYLNYLIDNELPIPKIKPIKLDSKKMELESVTFNPTQNEIEIIRFAIFSKSEIKKYL